MVTLYYALTFCKLQNVQLIWDDCQFQIMSIVICFVIFECRRKYLLIVKEKILTMIKWTCRFPPSPTGISVYLDKPHIQK